MLEIDVDTPHGNRTGRRPAVRLLGVVLALAVIVPWMSSPSGRAALHPGRGMDATASVVGPHKDTGFPRATHITALTVGVNELSRFGALWAALLRQDTVAMDGSSPQAGMTAAQEAASVAASAVLGSPLAPVVEVVDVVPGSPAATAGVQVGDVLVAVYIKDTKVHLVSAESLEAAVRSAGSGAVLRLELLRNHRTRSLFITTNDESRIGVLAINRAPETAIRFQVNGVSGGSAGLALALAAIDSASPGDLTAGLKVVATGALHFTGTVSPVVGVRQKLDSAPAKNADVVLVAAGQTGLPKDARIVRVATLQEAVSALCSLGASDYVCDVTDNATP